MDIDIVKAGCAGSKITVTPHIDTEERIFSETHDGIRCWVKAEFAEKLDGAQIARAKGKYYLVSKKIAARCGCGTSFSFEKKAISQDLAKMHRLQNALKMSPEMKIIKKRLLENYK